MYMNTINFEELENNISHNNMENTITDLSQQPIEYYYDINSTTRIPNNIQQFKQRASEIGFTGRPIYNGKISKYRNR